MVYATSSDVEPLIKFIDDSASTDLYTRALKNADDWVNARLLSNSLSIWTSSTRTETTEVNGEPTTVIITDVTPETPVPSLLNTAATYYAASDVLLSLFTGEDMPTQKDIYFQKAETMLEAYIAYQKDVLAETELKDKNPVKHHNGLSYYQRKHRRPRA